MSAIELLVGMFLAACVNQMTAMVTVNDQLYAQTTYECPLIADHAKFEVVRLVCRQESEQHAVAIMDDRTHQGYSLNQFGGIDAAFVDVRQVGFHTPHCVN